MIDRIVRILLLVTPLLAQSVDAPDLYQEFGLPALRDTTDLSGALADTQVGRRATALGLTLASAQQAWKAAGPLLDSVGELAPPALSFDFAGATTSELNGILAVTRMPTIRVTAPTLTVDAPIVIHRGSLTLDLGSAVLAGSAAKPYLIRVEGVRDVVIRGGQLASGYAGVLIASSERVRIEGMDVRGFASTGILVTGSTGVVVKGNRVRGGQGAGIVLHRGTANSVVEDNEISANTGYSNMTAGIVVTDREVNLAGDPTAILGPDHYWVVEQALWQRIHPPHDNLIVSNRVLRNLSSGIYVDGGTRNVLTGNTIESNAKEGLCLDNGSTANVVAQNTIRQNGRRWGTPDWVLAADHVLASGRLADGSAASKVPGISIDNAMYNIVFSNILSRNYGGGIKMVRTSYFNLVGMNSLFSNNEGASDTFHFFGIELGAAAGDDASLELDFTPSRGNVIFSNVVRGSHYAGVFFAQGSDQNDVLDNTLLDARSWALESVSAMTNRTMNNLTNLPSRNVGSGLDPALVTLGQAVMDQVQ